MILTYINLWASVDTLPHLFVHSVTVRILYLFLLSLLFDILPRQFHCTHPSNRSAARGVKYMAVGDEEGVIGFIDSRKDNRVELGNLIFYWLRVVWVILMLTLLTLFFRECA